MKGRSLCLTLGLMFAPAAPSLAAEDVMRLHFIDVGQGAATLVEFPCAAILVDTGGERFPDSGPAQFDSTRELSNYLRDFFAGRPDLNGRLAELILTHPHIDHTRGVHHVLTTYRPENVVYNGQATGSGGSQQVEAINYANTEKARGWYALQRSVTNPLSGFTNDVIDPISCASTHSTDPRIRILWGQLTDRSGWDAKSYADENNHSVVVRIDFAEASVIFPGDLEELDRGVPGAKDGSIERLLERFKGSPLLDADVYHVGHHGSHNGTTLPFVRAISPEIAVIPAGPPCKRAGFSAWEHGHPRKETLDELESGVTRKHARTVTVFDGPRDPRPLGIQKAIYSTGWDGTIVLEGKPTGVWRVVSRSGPHKCVTMPQ